jgi:CubicO group peptidase (beta-lactamase class C family)
MLAIWISGYTYIYKTLIFTYPGIDDLDIFDSRLIADENPQPLPVSFFYNKIKPETELETELKLRESVAFVVLKNDSIVYEQYWDQYMENSLINSFSVAKSIVGILTGVAVQKNLFSLEDPVGKYIPEFQNGNNSKLKIRHLITMSSGLNWDESYNSLFSKTTEAYYGTNLEKLVTKLKVVEEPGKIFRYMSCNTVLLSMIISKTSGKTISEFASEYLWKPIGAAQPAYWSLDHHDGLEKSYCCFYSTARDFARIGKLYLDSGKWNGKEIVSADFVNESVSPNGCIDETGARVDYYGYHWWMTNYDIHKIFYARGILGQYIIVIPDEKIVIIRLGKKRGEKVAGNRYSDMVAYTSGVLKICGTH